MPTFQNQAALTYRGGVVFSNIVTGELLAAVSVTKTAVEPTYSVGDTVTYVVSLVNTGAVCTNGLTVTDDLGAYPFGTGTLVPLDYVEGSVKYYLNGILQPAPTVTGNPLTFSGISVPAGGNALLVYSATVNELAPLGPAGSIENTVTVTGGGVLATATETVTAEDSPRLTVTKSLSPTGVSVGDPLTYTLRIENYGYLPIVATDDAVVSDTFDPRLSGLTAALDGIPLAVGSDYTYNEATGAFATLAGVVTVPAATVVQDPVSGAFSLTPGVSVLTVSGTVLGD